MTKDAKADFRDSLEDVPAGMLGLIIDGKLVQMSLNLRKIREVRSGSLPLRVKRSSRTFLPPRQRMLIRI